MTNHDTSGTKPPEQVHEPVLLDKKDLDILKLLQEDAKLTVRDIAARVFLSTTPVHDRIKRMEKEGVIKQYVALLDNRLVNKGIMAICYVTLREHQKTAGRAFVEAVVKFPEVLECYNVSGESDFMLKVLTESMKHYHDFYANRLCEIPGIGQTKSIFVMDIIKESHRLVF